VSTGGGVCKPLHIPSTGSMPIRAENFREVAAFSRTSAKAALPPQLWPASPSFSHVWLNMRWKQVMESFGYPIGCSHFGVNVKICIWSSHSV
jgi:hypothetical protein